ncbi:MAG: agmatine deiminase family protein [Hyphomicrobiales bacterium]
MPEEAEPHLRTFMQWPVNPKIHPDVIFLNMLQQSIADVANTIAEFEPVVMLMDKEQRSAAQPRLSANVEIWDVPTDDLWCRDSGPLFVRNHSGDLAVSQLNFNGWGGKQTHDNDGQIAGRIASILELPVFNSGLVGEAGGVESDGAGTLIAHESSWVNTNRNSHSKTQIERQLLQALGGSKVIWAPGVAGADITDYHIDSLARFSSPGVVVVQLPDAIDRNDPWSIAAFETYEILKNATDNTGENIQLVIIPEPYDTRIKSADFVASYVNYYVCNGAVIVAQFGDRETDSEAVRILKLLYPGREVVPLNVDPIGETGGGIHCATQQQPLIS